MNLEEPFSACPIKQAKLIIWEYGGRANSPNDHCGPHRKGRGNERIVGDFTSDLALAKGRRGVSERVSRRDAQGRLRAIKFQVAGLQNPLAMTRSSGIIYHL